jgi:hypothetical protein
LSGTGAISLAFQNLQELQLNATLIAWDDLMRITSADIMPKLRTLEAGYNKLGSLRTSGQPTSAQPPVFEVLNLDTNALDDWLDIVTGLRYCPVCASLRRYHPHALTHLQSDATRTDFE